MNRYMIAHDLETDAIVWAADRDKNSVTLVGPEDVVEDFAMYFSNPEEGWGRHLESDDPWQSFNDASSYSVFRPTNDEKVFAAAKEEILGNNGVEKTASWTTSK